MHWAESPAAVSATPALSVVLVARNDEERVGHQVRAIAGHLGQLGLPAEVLVVDEQSGDNTVAVLSLLRTGLPALSGLEVLAGAAPGRGFVEGALRARGRVLLLVDARTELRLTPLGFALARIEDGLHAYAVDGQYLLLRRLPALPLLSRLRHRRDPAALARAVLARAARAGLRTDASARAATGRSRLRAHLSPGLLRGLVRGLG